MHRYAIAVSVCMLFDCGIHAAEPQRQVTWEGLSAIIGRKVRLIMPDAARVEGQVLKVEVDALQVDIRKSSNRLTYPKGSFLVPRATLRALDVLEPPSKYWRIAGVATGALIGSALIYGAVETTKSSGFGGRAAGLAALGGGLPVLGYFVGRSADRRATTYVITQ